MSPKSTAPPTVQVRSRLSLRSTTRGANNRLDVDTIVTYDLEAGMALPMMGECLGLLAGRVSGALRVPRESAAHVGLLPALPCSSGRP